MKMVFITGDKRHFDTWASRIALLINAGYGIIYDPLLPFNYYQFLKCDNNLARMKEAIVEAEFLLVVNPSLIQSSIASVCIVYAHQIGKPVLFTHTPTVRNAGALQVYREQTRNAHLRERYGWLGIATDDFDAEVS